MATDVRPTPSKKSLSVVVPALNEEGNIQGSIDSVTAAAQSLFDDYEIIVVNDGSTDGTAAIVQANILKNPRIRMLSHEKPSGFGASYNTGRLAATMTYCVMVQGDSPFDKDQLSAFLGHTGEADVICGYIANPEFRGKDRQVISRNYTRLLNFSFRMSMHYFNGPQIHRTDWLKQLTLRNHGYGFQAEVLVKALKTGRSFKELPIQYIERPGGGATRIFKPKNMVSVLKTFILLWLWNMTSGGQQLRRVK